MEIITEIVGTIGTMINNLLDLLPYPILRPVILVAVSFLGAYFSTHKMQKMRWWRIAFLTAVFYLAISALGVK